MDETRQERIVAARMKLRERFISQIEQTPAMSDAAPSGSGPANRHGMPRLPVGQHEARGWPVLDLGRKPVVTREAWSLTLDGAVAQPTTLRWDDLMQLEQVVDTSDFHCVTTWSRFDMTWRGVRLSTLAALAEPHDDATHIMVHGSDGYTTNVSLVEALKDDVLVTWEVDGEPLPMEHGGPVRMITPQLYAWKGAKWISRIEFMAGDRPGFWEQRGYSMTAHPWRNDRYG